MINELFCIDINIIVYNKHFMFYLLFRIRIGTYSLVEVITINYIY